LGVKAYLIEGLVGVWVTDPISNAPKKIAAIGIKCKKWVAYHGIAINISTNLTKFDSIIACGISKYSVTSLRELGVQVKMERFDQILKEEFYKVFI
jgi:lipoyl(octanoyl) transferase